MPLAGADFGDAFLLEALGGMIVVFFIAGPLVDLVLLLMAMGVVLS